MTWHTYFEAVSIIALASSPVVATEVGDDPLVGIDHSLSEIASPPTGDEVPQSLQPEMRADWFMAEQLRRTEAARSNPKSGELASGWIDRNLFVLIEQGRVTYLIRRPDPIAGSRPASDVCRISIPTKATNIVFPDAIAGVSESERGCKAPPPWLLERLVHARPSAGEVSNEMQLSANDGSALKVRHFTNANAAGVPLVSADKADNIRSIYQMPTTWLLARKTTQQAWVVENDDQTYALAVKFDIERTGQRSGCLVRADDGRFPNLDWISNDLRQWCVERDRAFARSIAPKIVPRPPVPRER